MAVQVSDICDRCGRSTPVHMTNDDLVAETEKRKRIEQTCKEIEEFIRSKDPLTLPTLLVMYGGESPALMIKSQISVCNPKGEGKRSCAKRVSELVNDLFPVPTDERAPRKPKTTKPAPNGGGKSGGKK